MAVLCTLRAVVSLMVVSCVKKTDLRHRAGCGHGVDAQSFPKCLANPCLEENEPCSLCSDITLNNNSQKQWKSPHRLQVSNLRFHCIPRVSSIATCLFAYSDEDRPKDWIRLRKRTDPDVLHKVQTKILILTYLMLTMVVRSEFKLPANLSVSLTQCMWYLLFQSFSVRILFKVSFFSDTTITLAILSPIAFLKLYFLRCGSPH